MNENIEEIDALTRIANSLLSLVGEKSKHTQLDIPVSIYDIVSCAVKKLTPLANSRQIAITIESEESLVRAQVCADESALTRTFENLIENSIKYTDKEGTVKVVLSHKGDLVLITVSDSGIGISSADLVHVTEPFFRADTARTSNEGSGLGLAIVLETLRAHSGNLHIESELGVGTIVRVALPLVKIT